jgi:hypothetical protein
MLDIFATVDPSAWFRGHDELMLPLR